MVIVTAKRTKSNKISMTNLVNSWTISGRNKKRSMSILHFSRYLPLAITLHRTFTIRVE